MKFLKSLGLAALLAVTGLSAQAAVIFATSVDSYTQGANVSPARAVTANALGAPDGSFLSLGLGGEAILSFGQAFTGPGKIWEITFGSTFLEVPFPELVDVYVGYGGVFTFLTNVNNLAAQPGGGFAFAGTFDQVKLIDTSPAGPLGLTLRDGFDVDAVGVSEVPLPAAGVLMLAALGGLALARRRRT